MTDISDIIITNISQSGALTLYIIAFGLLLHISFYKDAFTIRITKHLNPSLFLMVCVFVTLIYFKLHGYITEQLYKQ